MKMYLKDSQKNKYNLFRRRKSYFNADRGKKFKNLSYKAP